MFNCRCGQPTTSEFIGCKVVLPVRGANVAEATSRYNRISWHAKIKSFHDNFEDDTKLLEWYLFLLERLSLLDKSALRVTKNTVTALRNIIILEMLLFHH